MGERGADLAALYLSERGRLQRRIARLIGDRALAADLVHDLFVRLIQRTGVFSGDPTAYLTRSARNVSVDHLRAERVRAAFIAGTVPEQHGADAPSPHDIVSARQQLRRVDDVIRDLPERTRHIFLLNRVHGCGYSEIARALGISASAVEKHMHRALVALRRSLDEEG